MSEQTISLQQARVLEALQCDLEIPCIVQVRTLWFSAPTSLNNEPLNDGVILDKYNETVNFAFQSVFTLPYWRMKTQTSCFLRSIGAVLENMLERIWDLEREMVG